jgi:ABC-2 type transport system permease protein
MTAKIVPGFDRKLKNHTSITANIRNSLTMAYRHLLLIRRNPEQLFDVIIQPILFTLMFTYLFGGAISGNVTSYLPIVIPGIMVQTALTATMGMGVQLNEDMVKGVFNRFKSLPISHEAPITGAAIADLLRYSIATTLTIALGYALGFRCATIEGAVVGCILIILAAWCISWIFAFMGVIAKSTTTVQGISMAILFPLTFLSNAFVPTSTLPDWLQTFVKLNPVTYLVSAVRQLFSFGTIGNDFWYSLIGIAIVVAIFAPLTIVFYMRKIRSA